MISIYVHHIGVLEYINERRLKKNKAGDQPNHPNINDISGGYSMWNCIFNSMFIQLVKILPFVFSLSICTKLEVYLFLWEFKKLNWQMRRKWYIFVIIFAFFGRYFA